MIVDTHIHLYDPFRAEGTPWPDPNDPVLHQTTLPERWLERAIPAGVDGAIVVECSEWVEDNQWVLDLADDEPRLFGLVGNLNANHPQFAAHLARFAQHPVFRGIRARLWTPNQVENIRLLSDYDLSLDSSLNELTIELATEIPDLRIVINHCAGLPMNGEPPDPEVVTLIRNAAEFPNVYCKLSGMMDLRCTIRPAPTAVEHYAPYLDILWDAFGEDRMIFGSDWPVSDGSERTYAQVLALAQAYVAQKPASAEAKVFCENAQRAYKWVDRRDQKSA
ncbi:MAG: amidohydrolase family protein [Litorilinea sp.]